MNRQKRIIFTAGTLSLLFLFSTFALAAPPENFTSKMVTMGLTMPMAKMGNKTRVENPMIGGLVTISQMDAQKTVTMNTRNKTYFEQTQQERKVPSLYDPNVVIEKKKIGSEAIDGHPCVKYDTVFYKKDNPKEKFKAVIWEAQDLGGLPIRNEITIPENKKGPGPGKMVSEMKDIKVGAATASMFEVPRGYKKVDSMNAVMGFGQPGNTQNLQELMKQMQKMKR
jgi:hypothetical protein